MSEYYELIKQKSKYYDKNSFSNQEQYDQAVNLSSTVYVGNLSYFCSQDSIKQLFSRAGKVKKIIMGINNQGQRCGFCFVIFQTHQQAQYALQYISHTKLDNKIIRVDIDPGYKQGRQKGRGRDGNQKRDDFRNKQFDTRGDRSRGKYNDGRGSYERRNDKFYDRRKDGGGREERSYGQERFQRNRQNRVPIDQQQYHDEPRKMERKEFEQKEEQY